MYTDNSFIDEHGNSFSVLDVKAVSFDEARLARKTAETLVKRASGGEVIQTKDSDGNIESSYVANEGDAIFINLHNDEDKYVPSGADGRRWKFDSLKENGYEVTKIDEEKGGVRVINTTTYRVLPEVIDRPTCILNAFGEQAHQLLYPGAALKLAENGIITGISGEAFKKTWELV